MRWSSTNNEIVGICGNHQHNLNTFKLNNIEVVDQYKDALNDKTIHFATEALVISLSFLENAQQPPIVVLVLPICSHECTDLLKSAIECIQNKIESSSSTLINIATDGDGTRRKFFESQKKIQNYLPELAVLEHFDQSLLYGTLSIDYDVKHLIKRVRTSVVSKSDKKTIITIKTPFNKLHMKKLFPKDKYPNIESLLLAKDKQNVPCAVKLLQIMYEIEPDNFESITTKDIAKEIKVYGYIGHLLLSVFVDPTIHLSTQLLNLAELSFILLIIYRKYGTRFILTALYLDIQSTIQGAFVAVAYFKKICSSSPLYLHLLGTDQLESLFSVIRTITHAKNVDFIELIDKINIANQIETIYLRNDDWKRQSRLVASSDDKSSVRSWNGNNYFNN